MSIPYLITYISYNCVHNFRGIISEDLLDKFILDNISEYIINNSFSTKFETVVDIVNFWERYGGYNVWEAYCVKNDNWMNIKPSDELILENVRKMTEITEIMEENIEKNNIQLDENFGDFFEENADIDNVNSDINIDWSTIYIQEREEQCGQEE